MSDVPLFIGVHDYNYGLVRSSMAYNLEDNLSSELLFLEAGNELPDELFEFELSTVRAVQNICFVINGEIYSEYNCKW